jgi:hypothetical protein
LKRIRQELGEHFTDMDQADKYGRQMWNFVGKANSQLEDLTDDVNLADSTFTEVIKYFGEEDRNMSSSEFFGIFKTFVTSYKVSERSIEMTISAHLLYRNARPTIRLLRNSNWQCRSGSRQWKRPKLLEKRPKRLLLMVCLAKRKKTMLFSTIYSRNFAMATQ